MTQRLNPNIADALDMNPPDDSPETENTALVTVEPHEIAHVDNEELPEMADLETSILEAEKQREELIIKGMDMVAELYNELPKIEPKYRNRQLEIIALLMGETRTAVEHKSNHNLKRKEHRMKEAAFGKNSKGNTKIGTANFYGSREELLKAVDQLESEESPPVSESE
jgi:hypothetical protein